VTGVIRPPAPFERKFGTMAGKGAFRVGRPVAAPSSTPPAALAAVPVAVFVAAILCTIAAAFLTLPTEAGAPVPAAVAAAAARAEASMRDAEAFIRARKIDAGLLADIQGKGLLGEELTPLTTTLGSHSAKRTAEDPRWAAVLVEKLWGAGLREGDFVAASFSGSFPGLNLAFSLACRSLGLRLAVVSSVTASTYGANQSGFTWPEMEVLLSQGGYLEPVSVGVAAGGAEDTAADLEPEARSLAAEIARRSAKALGAGFIEPASLADAVGKRMSLYREAAKGKRMALYANIGGADASLGTSDAVIELSSGFLPPYPFDLSKERGVMAMMMEEGVPVMSLLNVRDLALRWGIPIDE